MLDTAKKTHANTVPMHAPLNSYTHTHTRADKLSHALCSNCVLVDGITEAETRVYERAGFMYFHCFVCEIGKLDNLLGIRQDLQAV